MRQKIHEHLLIIDNVPTANTTCARPDSNVSRLQADDNSNYQTEWKFYENILRKFQRNRNGGLQVANRRLTNRVLQSHQK